MNSSTLELKDEAIRGYISCLIVFALTDWLQGSDIASIAMFPDKRDRKCIDQKILVEIDSAANSHSNAQIAAVAKPLSLRLVSSLLSEGLMKIGSIAFNGRFTPWNCSLEESLLHVKSILDEVDENTWPWIGLYWLDLTDKGHDTAINEKKCMLDAHGCI